MHVQVSNRPIVPGAALLEATLSAAFALDADRTPAGLSLQQAAIPAPLLLPKQPGTGAIHARISLDCRLGTSTLESAAISSSAWTAHLQATAVRCSTPGQHNYTRHTSWLVLSRAAAVEQQGPVACVSVKANGCQGWRCHPAAIDSAMHLSLYTGPEDQRTRVPGEL